MNYQEIIDLSVVVEMSNGETNENISCSGLKIGQGIYLTHSTVLSDVFLNHKRLSDNILKNKILYLDKNTESFDHYFSNRNFKVYEKGNYGQDLTTSMGLSSSEVQIGLIFSIPGILDQILSEDSSSSAWESIKAELDTDKDNSVPNVLPPEVAELLACSFVLLFNPDESLKTYWLPNLRIALKEIRPYVTMGSIGDAVGLVGTPFGTTCPQVFHGFLSRGVISARRGPVFFTDAPAARGVEGAPVVRMANKKICGLVIYPCFLQEQHWIGLSMVVSFPHLWMTLWNVLSELSTKPEERRSKL